MQTVNPVVDRWRREATEDPDVFWGRAADQLPWFRKWDKVFQWDFPTFRWFINAQTNLAYNCLDVQVARGNGGKAAIIYTNERGERRVFTYAQTLFEVKRIAAALRGLGIKRGDTLTIYMPTCPEAIFTMLATVRIGAIHCAVFAGFAASALADRIAASQSKLVFTSDIAYRKGGEVALKGLVDEAVSKVEKGVEHVIVLQRRKEPPAMTPGRDIGWDKFLEGGIGKDSRHEIMESNEPAYILATSGTSAKPKICVHTHGDYAVGITSSARWCFGLKETDVWWATSDIGWVVGHSYIVYAPLLLGCTSVAYEGALDYPGPDTLWRIIEEFKVNAIFTSPTAVRLLMRYGEAVAKQYDFSSLDRVFCAGETLNPSAWEWLQKKVFDNRIPVIDHYWQTETGGPVLGNPYGLGMVPIKPGSASLPLPGKEVAVMSLDGKPCPPGEKGILVVKRPFPGLTARLWGEPERYGRDYYSLQALSPTICRPFDSQRDGLALGEGAAVFALESLEAAKARRATILGEVVGYGASTDAHHLTQPHPEGQAAFQAMSTACRCAGLQPGQIGYVNAHGTGTLLNDSAEAAAINRWAGDRAPNLPVSSTKASVGHLLGAAGAVEAAVCLMALQEQWLPPSATVQTPDPAARFVIVREQRAARFEYALSNSFGFGGANASLILRRWS